MDESLQGTALVMDTPAAPAQRLMFLESYGCQMNFSDSEIVASIMQEAGYGTTSNFRDADLILVNTCAIREGAEQRVRSRLKEFNALKRNKKNLMVGVLGCMAERLKSKFLEEEKIVDLVVGPDAYRDLPNLIRSVDGGQRSVNVLLSLEETYADINPVRLDSNGVTAFISITRGCDNMCSFCVVPYTRGRERSRDPESIVTEAKDLFDKGYREVTLLGQNVDSYLWANGKAKKELSDQEIRSAFSFADLLDKVALVSPELRIRFSTSNPQDMTDDVLNVMSKHENICRYIHLPVQSGCSSTLERMNRGYNREQYIDRIKSIRRIVPDCGISTDIMTGFCGETEEEHQETLSLMKEIKFDFAYMFAYSERPGTAAHKKYKDDVPESIKKKRLQEVIDLQMLHSSDRTMNGVGKIFTVLAEGTSKRSKDHLYGRNSQNTVVVFPAGDHQKGDYVKVKVDRATPATLIGQVIKE